MSEIFLDGDLLSDELLLFCQSDSISLEGLHEIFQRYGITADDSRHVNDYDFFLFACYNEHVDEAIIQCLVEYFPDAVDAISVHRQTPLHLACRNKNVTPSIVRLMITAHPSFRQQADENGDMPLHCFCNTQINNDSDAIEILKILLKDCSSSTKNANKSRRLPIHFASKTQSPEFCAMLIDAYPGSVRMPGDELGQLPFHFAIFSNNVTTVEYLYELYPEAMNCFLTTSTGPIPPIYVTIMRLRHQDDSEREGAADIVRFLLKYDPNIKFQKFDQRDPLSYACRREYDYSNIDDGMKVVEAIYDAHPELINDDELDFHFHECHSRIQTFLNGEFVYANQAMDHRRLMTPDENGQLPLHHALENNVRLGSIKLLVDGSPFAIQEGDHNSAIPLHVACEHHDSEEVIQYLVGLDPSLLRCEDTHNNTALHYACRGAKYTTIALLLDQFDAISVSKKNRHSKLPIDLLLESNSVEDRESAEYVDSIFRLLRAYPGTLIDKAMEARQSVLAPSSSTDHVGKKRKVGD